MVKKYILAIDQGTSSSRAIIFDDKGKIVASAQKDFRQIYPHNGWVEHDPEEIWSSVLEVSRKAVNKSGVRKIAAIGITNQRETTIVWDRKTGRPVYNAIVWQDRRAADLCKNLRKKGNEKDITKRTGLLLDPYFSATKLAWILDNVKGARKKAEQGRLAFGTVDSFLLWRLTDGEVHATDATNASRTMLYNIYDGCWDKKLLKLFNIPESVLPEVKDSSAYFGRTKLLGGDISITGIAGDQQAATVGQACFKPGMVKSTYGTGCFVMVNTGAKPIKSKHRLLTTIAYQINGKPTYAIEGSIFIAGAAVKWLRDDLGIIKNAGDTEKLAAELEDNGGVYLVPALTGLGAPYWEPEVRGALFGITRNTGIAHITRATLESVCYQTQELLATMHKDGIKPKQLRVDGGMVGNDWLMQFLSDILDVEVDRPIIGETTVLGAAYLAGLQVGIFKSLDDIARRWQLDKSFSAKMSTKMRKSLLQGWNSAVESTRKFSS